MMAEGQSMTAADVVQQARAGEEGDFIRRAVELVVRELMEAEIAEEIGAAKGGRRTTHRNGYRPRGMERFQTGTGGPVSAAPTKYPCRHGPRGREIGGRGAVDCGGTYAACPRVRPRNRRA
jgi:hypothetical protein